MNYGEMVAFARLHADADDTDMPDDTLLVYARTAFNDILSRRFGWDHLSVNYTLTTTAGTDSYPLSALTGGTDLDRVTSIVDRTVIGRRLMPVTRADADLIFSRPSLPSSTNAAAYTVEGSSIILFPSPSTTGRQYTVRGFKDAAAWPNGPSSTPDLPSALHDAIPYYMISQYYMSQEDQDLAEQYRQLYERLVDQFVSGETSKARMSRPTVMGGQYARTPSFNQRVRGMLE